MQLPFRPSRFFTSVSLMAMTVLPAAALAAGARATVVFDWNAMTVTNLTGTATFSDSVAPTTSALATDLSRFIKSDSDKATTAAISVTTTSTVSPTSIVALAGQGYAGGESARGGKLTFSREGVAVVLIPYSYAISALGNSESATAKIHFAATSVLGSGTSTGIYSSVFDRNWEVARGLTESGKGVMQIAISSEGSDSLQLRLEGSSAAWAYGDLTPLASPIPEPAAAAMFMSGLLLTGACVTRRRRALPRKPTALSSD